MKGTELADAIRDEMAKAGNSYIEMMGEMMTEYLRIHPDTEIDDKKNLKGAFSTLQGAARKKAKGGCYAMPPREVFDGMMEYFALPHADADFRACMTAVFGQGAPETAAKLADAGVAEICGAISRRHEDDALRNDLADEFDLDALLGV